LRWWDTSLDPVEKLLLKDAVTRQAFNHLTSNRLTVLEAVTKRVVNRIGPFPYESPEEEKQRYRTECDRVEGTECSALEPMLPGMLQATSGILFPSTVALAWDGKQHWSTDCLNWSRYWRICWLGQGLRERS